MRDCHVKTAPKKTAIVTGSAGFIGSGVCRNLLDAGYHVTGIDSMNDYYDVQLKRDRLALMSGSARFTHIEGKVETRDMLADSFAQVKPDIVVHLAGQAGVRHSIDNPRAYYEANIGGTFELLEAARAHPPKHMLLASTSSAYGGNTEFPYRETQKTDHQMSFYAATKKSTENMAHSYAHLFDLPITMFRFFTVYGPWGRPDMAHYKFTRAILESRHIDVYNHGQMQRDFTYIDDLTRAITLLLEAVPQTGKPVNLSDSISPVAPFRVVNIGNSQMVELMDFIKAIENATGVEAQMNMMPIQPGDVPATWADGSLLNALTGYMPQTSISDGVTKYVAWFRGYYGL